MKYSIFGFNQEIAVEMTATKKVKGKLVEIKLDVSDLLILQSIADFINRPKIQKTIINDKIYCWVKHSVILEDLPILNIKKQAFADKLDKLVMFGLLEKEVVRAQIGTMSYFRIGANYENLVYSDSKCSKTHVRTGSQLHLRTCSQLQDKDYSTNDNSTNDYEDIELFGTSTEAPTKTDRVPYKEIVGKYNVKFAGILPKVTAITDKRKKAMNTCVKQFGIESIDEVFDNVLSSNFLTGNNDRGWKCDFDFIFTASKYVRILEGNYRNTNGNTNGGAQSEGSAKYRKFISWVNEHAPRVLKMKAKLDEKGYRSIKNECGFEEMKRKLIEMNNYENLLTEYADPVMTCINWR